MLKQEVIKISQNRKLRHSKLPIGDGVVKEEKTIKAWYYLRHFLGLFGKSTVLVVDDYFALPINPYTHIEKEELKKLTNVDTMYIRAKEDAGGKAAHEGRMNVLAWGMTTCVIGLVLVVIILAILVAAGRINL